jgi:hypothetical protein
MKIRLVPHGDIELWCATVMKEWFSSEMFW